MMPVMSRLTIAPPHFHVLQVAQSVTVSFSDFFQVHGVFVVRDVTAIAAGCCSTNTTVMVVTTGRTNATGNTSDRITVGDICTMGFKYDSMQWSIAAFATAVLMSY